MFLSGSCTISYTSSRLRSSLSLPLLRLMSFFFPLLNYIPGLSNPSLRPARSFFLTSCSHPQKIPFTDRHFRQRESISLEIQQKILLIVPHPRMLAR